MLSDADAERALIVTAHPDDVDFGAAGTVATWTDAGIEVSYCIVTDGDAGGFDPAVPRHEIPGIRRAEQLNAAKLVGVEDVHFLGYPDGALELSHPLRRDITRVIRKTRPQRMVVQSPERNWARIHASHPDHLTAGEAALRALYPDSRNPFAHPELLADEGLEPWTVQEVWVTSHPKPEHFVDITDQFDRKIAALRAHESQTAHMDDLAMFVKEWLVRNAKAAGLPEGRLAEAFVVHPTA
ncbi:MAG: PIG-L family deacetylase [Sporichthyaceae bacterium]|nr:PIG-L family deacetylase [Sporichthyaceae bacterium]